jgi:hypothetical protein
MLPDSAIPTPVLTKTGRVPTRVPPFRQHDHHPFSLVAHAGATLTLHANHVLIATADAVVSPEARVLHLQSVTIFSRQAQAIARDYQIE